MLCVKFCAGVRHWKGGLLVLCEDRAKVGNFGWIRLVWVGVFSIGRFGDRTGLSEGCSPVFVLAELD